MADTKVKEGWGFPLLAKKAHYFRDGRSLCMKWLYLGDPTPNQKPGSPDDCKDCLKRYYKMYPKKEDSHDGSAQPG